MNANVAVSVGQPVRALQVPFFRPDMRSAEIAEVVASLESGWLTTGPRVHRFEDDFRAAVCAEHAVALNSCTAALHLAVEALGLAPGAGVLVPTMTFAATAEVVRYLGGVPVLVDCDPVTGHMNLRDAEQRVAEWRADPNRPKPIVGIMPVHVGGLMMDVDAVAQFAAEHDLWIVEDAAHSMPAAWRRDAGSEWVPCGAGTADVTCFSFYANKTLTTGEGGMAVTNDPDLAARMRLMSLHGLSHDAWGRYNGSGSWNYDIVAPGFKYNMTDVAAAIGIHQLARAHEMRDRRESIAAEYRARLGHVDEVGLPPMPGNGLHAWHLFPIRLEVERLSITRDDVIELLKAAGITTAVHWKPLHLHPYYQQLYRLTADDYPVATDLFTRIVSLPLFPTMTDEEILHVSESVTDIVVRHRRR
jgi:perosamine synthetase